MKIERDQIVREALALLDECGLDNLNMRALADRLGVKASALYWHVAHKAELMELMTYGFYVRAKQAAPKGVGWRQWLIGFGESFHAILVSHRDSARLCALIDPDHNRVRAEIDLLLSPLLDEGFDRDVAASYETAVIAISLGFAVLEQSKSLHDFFEEDLGFRDAFQRGLGSMVNGFAEAKADLPKRKSESRQTPAKRRAVA